MVKPNGLYFGLRGSALTMCVTNGSRAEDLIWEAVEEAISDGMDPTHFRREAAMAWQETLNNRAERESAELLK